jgi:hypothetical protein
MKVTTRAWPGSGRQHPYLWDVVVDGQLIDTNACRSFSRGRVLKMGRRYLPVLDRVDDVRITLGSCATRRAAAEVVAEVARERGLV